jgi:signal transduction histidine kinase/CheY-like chemotaxis protein/HPt (histidine-containing phosphotransfer) domain-containing protein
MMRRIPITRLTVVFFTFFVILYSVTGFFIYHLVAASMKSQMGDKCLGIATAVAALIEQDTGSYREFIADMDLDSEYYRELKANMERIRFGNSDSIAFLYAEVKVSDTEMMYVVDSEVAGTETYAKPGLTEPLTETRRVAYDTQASYIGGFLTTMWGRLLSAYAPVFDRDTGEFIGLVGADVSIKQYDDVMRYHLIVLWVSIGAMVLMMLILNGVLRQVYQEKVRSDEENASKSSFLARMSHEIRTPMNAITGMTELMLREDLSPLVKEQAAGIRQASANLLAIINDILDFSKVESGKLEILEAPYQFSSLINDVISVIRMRVVDKPVLLAVYIDSRLPNEMVGDEVRIRQILMNVLSNAVKFTDEGHVTLRIEGTAGEENTVLLTIKVIDSGVGIKSEELDKLFEEFTQFDKERDHNIEGTGLGLAITKNLCVNMGGDITASSVYGEGSAFTITLPQRYEKFEPFAAVEDPGEKRVLVYETRAVYAENMIMTLENLGVPGKLVSSRSTFVTELRENKYTHVFVSSFLYDYAKRSMARVELRDTALILLSEYGEGNVLASDAGFVAMPAHAGSISNALNGNARQLQYNESVDKSVRFVAPDARVLVVDDVNTNLNVTEGLLSPFQMIVDGAKNGREAIALVKANHYDLVLMDHMMPEMDGIETTAEIRALGEQDEYYKNLPIVALTANAISGVKDMFLQSGMHDYLVKPIDIAELYAILEKWIPKQKQEKYMEKTAASAKLCIEIKGIDTKVGLAMTGGSQENYQRVLAAFYMDGEEKKTQLCEALETKNLSLFTTYVHALKSAAGSIGAWELSEAAKKLESAGTSGDIAYITDNLASFTKLLSEITEQIGQALPGSRGIYGVSAEEDGPELGEMLLTLKEGLEKINVAAIDKTLNSLRSTAWTAATQKKIAEIDKLILLFDYDEAIEIITAMSG